MPQDAWASANIIRPHHSTMAFFYRFSDIVLILGGLIDLGCLYQVNLDVNYWMAALLAVLFFLIYAHPARAYVSARGVPISYFIWPVILAWGATAFTLMAIAYVTKTSQEFSRTLTLTWFMTTPVLLLMWRWVVARFVQWRLASGHYSHHVAIAGSIAQSLDLVHLIEQTPSLGLNLRGVYDDRSIAGDREAPGREDLYRGGFDDLVAAAHAGRIDLVYITLPLKAEDRIAELISRLADTTVSIHYVPNFLTFDLLHSRWINLGPIPTISIRETPFYGADGWLKNAEDVILASLALLVFAVPMLVIALAVKLDSPGPVLFLQHRYGLDGRAIRVLKFRSMRVCEDGAQVSQASRGDARLTRLGAFLRRYSLDELPQIINVLRGEMSMVGPRPHAVAHNEQYRKLIPGYMLRHKVKPGITGWAQVNGLRGETQTVAKMFKRVEYDMYYIRNWSLWLDLKILLLTSMRVFSDPNAY